ncbi:MAG: PilZ domain-containing protein [Spirochaetales bacterium]|nr:PilZ domain-containing protein [Spirochaetales bacterium]
MAERRKIHRSDLKGLINYYETQIATSRNVSHSGIAIKSRHPLEKGTPLYVKIPDKKKYHHRFGVITRCVSHEEGYYEIAVQFTDKQTPNNLQVESQQQPLGKEERRSSARFNSIKTIQFSPLMNGMIKNFNNTGLCLYTTRHIKINQPIYLIKPISTTDQLMIKGVVVWQKANSKGLRQSGIRFENVKVIQKSRFLKLFSKTMLSHIRQ